MKKYLYIFILVLLSNFVFSQNIDSLKNILQNSEIDSIKIRTNILLAFNYIQINKDSSENYINQAIDLIQKKENILVKDYKNIANYYIQTNKLNKTLEFFNLAKDIAKFNKNLEEEISINNSLGYYYNLNGEYENAFSVLLETEKLISESGIIKYKSRNYLMLGFAYRNYGDLDKAFSYFEKSSNALENEDFYDDKSVAINELGNVESFRKNYDKALEYHLEAMQMREEKNQIGLLSFSYNDISIDYLSLKNYDKALEYLFKSLTITKKNYDEMTVCINFTNIANVYVQKKDFYVAKNYLDSANIICIKLNSKSLYENIYGSYYDFYKSQNIFDKALENYELMIIYRDSTRSEESDNKINELQVQYETVKKDKEIIKANESLKRKNIIIYSAVIGFVTVFSLLLLLFKQFKDKKIAFDKLKIQNAEILQKNEEILAQSEEIVIHRNEIEIQNEKIKIQNYDLEHKNKQITNSILYAKRIQNAILPTFEDFNLIFENNFIFYKPRDIVSGDFYWAKYFKNIKLLAVADCTGHGVPGAFMSMLGVALLNEIVRQENVTTANEVLEQLRFFVKKSLQQSGKQNESKDGMDISLCVINQNNELQFAGANNSVIIIRNNEIIELKADKQPIGIYVVEKPFSLVEFNLHENDIIYLFSDGYRDQFGGANGEKYKLNRFKNLLSELSKLPIENQNKFIETDLYNWQNNLTKKYEQVDDILIVGIRI